MRPRIAALAAGLGLTGLMWVVGGCTNSGCDSDRDGYEALRCGGDDCNDATYLVHPDAAEVCDLLDNDCDGEVDGENALEPPTWYRDGDGDGYGDSNDSTQSCSRPEGYVNNDLDCDDTRTLNRPGGIETCDGVDNDCDGEVDDNIQFAPAWFVDADGDGHGDPAAPVVEACSAPDGYVGGGGDCDDTNPQVHPDQEEVCGDGIDNNCDLASWGCGFGGTMAFARQSVESWSEGNAGAQFGSSIALGAFGPAGELSLVSAGPALGTWAEGRVWTLPLTEFPDGAANSIRGSDPGVPFGRMVASGGDANGDGVEDLLVVRAENVQPGAWAEVLLYGGPFDSEQVEADALCRSGLPLAGGPDYGRRVAFFPDYDGDGDDEILISQPGYGATSQSSGRVLLFEGGGEDCSLDPEDAALVFTSAGSSTETFGWDLAPGDFNGDGISDLAISAPGAWPHGAVYVFFGPLSPGNLSPDEADFLLRGDASASYFGPSMSNVGNQDEVPGDELLIAGYTSSTQVTAMWLHSAEAQGELSAGKALARFGGPSRNWSVDDLPAALRVGHLGDLDGDGVDELGLLTYPGNFNEWQLSIFSSGERGELSEEFAMSRVTGLFCPTWSTSGWVFDPFVAPGDLNGDGYDDLLLAEPGAPTQASQTGAVHLLLGGPGL